MAFRQSTYMARFNSATSSEFLNFYQDSMLDEISKERNATPVPMMSPSSFRCARQCWFKIRGVEPSKVQTPDLVLEFKAQLGNACHLAIQNHLIKVLGVDWIDVENHLKSNPMPWPCELSREGTETRIVIPSMDFRMSCDGIIRWKDKLYLLEIKTIEYSTFGDLTDPMPKHSEQVMCYATMLGLDSVLFLYQERTYGGLKCYEVSIPLQQKKYVIDKIESIQESKRSNIAPPKLPAGDEACSNCLYKDKCKQWG